MALRLSAWRSEPNVNKFYMEAEEGSSTINKIKPIISAAALAVSLFQAAVEKQHSRTRRPFIPGQRASKRQLKNTHHASICVS